MGISDLPRPPEFLEVLAALIQEADAVVAQLGDEEGRADLEELARSLQKVHADAHSAAMQTPGHHDLDGAVRHFHEACDLIDDGMPADAVIFEVLAARARLEALLKPGV